MEQPDTLTNIVQEHSSGQNSWKRWLLWTASTAVALTLLLLAVDIKNYLSRKRVYDDIQIGMSGADANRILLANEVFCDSSQAQQSHECTFDDFWRVYKIGFSEPDYAVARKRFMFKRHTSSLIGKTLDHLLR
jgi:hypothetical protein